MKTRKGLSSVVGTVFAIIALASVVTYVTYSLDILDKFNQGVLVRNEETLDRGKEEFEVLSATIDSSKFNITISNTGTLPINITKMWVQNKSATDWVNGYDIKKSVAPDGVLIKIGQNAPLYANTANAYVVKLVTERGNTKEFSVNSGITAPLYVQLHAIPSSLADEFTTTLLFEVVNNMSSNDLLLNLTPVLQKTTSGSVTYQEIMSALPASYPSLAKGETAYFKWIYKIDGSVGSTVTFNASLANGYQGNIALATVTLQEVLFASQSASSIESEGFTCCKTPDNTLVMHQETLDTPSNVYQIYSGEVESSGTTIDLQTHVVGGQPAGQVSFYTYNDTNSRDIPKGNWKTILRYRSSALPDAFLAAPASPSPNMIFHFNDTTDSSGNNNALTLVNNPVYSASGKHGNSGIYTFTASSSQYMNITRVVGQNDIGTEPDSTAAWFKVANKPAPLSKYIIYRIEGLEIAAPNQLNQEYYEIAMDEQGRIVFSYKPSTTLAATVCTSSVDSADNQWHHFVAVRGDKRECMLFIDAIKRGQDNSSGSGTQAVDSVTNVAIGRDSNGRDAFGLPIPSYFNGALDYLMHWNNYAVQAINQPGGYPSGSPPTKDEVVALYRANYGNASHTVDLTLSKTNKDGTATLYTFHSKPKLNYTFVDSKGSTGITSYVQKNYTIYLENSTQGSGGTFNMLPNERLKLKIDWNSANNNALDMYWRIDDNLFADRRGSYLEIPTPTSTFPSFFVWDMSNPLKFTVTNAGPQGVWMTASGTRAVFDAPTGTASYAALVDTVNATSLTASSDSPYIGVNQRADLQFFMPKKIPKQTGGQPQDDIVPGTYYMYINILGYDDTGSNVLKTFPVGLIRVVA